MRASVLSLFLPLAAAQAGAPEALPGRAPDKVLTGTISRESNQTYLRKAFHLPAGTDRLVVAFDYDHREDKTVIDLGIEDTNGFRGASGGNKTSFTIAQSDATPSYLPGRLDPGEWALNLAVPNIRKGVTARWKAKLWFLKGAEAQWLPTPTRGRGKGWYRGDLHMHTAHSDGSCQSLGGNNVPCPLFRTLEVAQSRGLDFVAVSEHNTSSQAQMMREAQGYFDTILLIPAREITTFFGHFNVFGITSPLDFRVTRNRPDAFRDIARRVHDLGGLVSINHPALPSGEACMGCGWTMPDTDYAQVDAVEIVNGGAIAGADGNPEGFGDGEPFWLRHTNYGHPIAVVGGSDNHDPNKPAAVGGKPGFGGLAAPATVVEADDLSMPAILDGIRKGRSFIQIGGPASLRLDFRLAVSGGTARMGGRLQAQDAVALDGEVVAPDGTRVDILDGGHLLARQVIMESTTQHWKLPALGKGGHVIRLKLRSESGDLLAVSNSIVLDCTALCGAQ
ncbi:hypothetical conserved protein [Novosphingobium sp. MBES04]|nr:hypothetical conserved protein [Novosphingobium sp. MBES04]